MIAGLEVWVAAYRFLFGVLFNVLNQIIAPEVTENLISRSAHSNISWGGICTHWFYAPCQSLHTPFFTADYNTASLGLLLLQDEKGSLGM